MSKREERLEKLQQALFYGIVDGGYVQLERMLEVAQALIDGGAGVIQLRMKNFGEEEIEEMGRKLQPVCESASVLFIINDYPKIAVAVGADGVHIGQEDGTEEEMRELVGNEMLVGRSTHAPEQAQNALNDGFDYIGFGPLFPTPTKQGRPGIGLEAVAMMQKTIGEQIPMFCIGGVKRDNLGEVIAAGARRAVVVSDVLLAEDVAVAAREITSLLDKAGNR